MAPPSNPLRTQCEEFVRAEIARLGVAGVDTAAVVRRFVELGATRSRVHSWVTELKRQAGPPPPPDPVAEAAAAVEAAAAAVEEAAQVASLDAAREVAAVLDSLPNPAELAAVSATVEALVQQVASPPPVPSASVEAGPAESITLTPTSAQAMMDQVHRMIATCNKVLEASCAADGRIRNAKQALAAMEASRRVIETGFKFNEAVSNIQQIERFMEEMIAAVRKLSPETAEAVVAAMRGVQTRWSRVQGSAHPRVPSLKAA